MLYSHTTRSVCPETWISLKTSADLDCTQTVLDRLDVKEVNISSVSSRMEYPSRIFSLYYNIYSLDRKLGIISETVNLVQ